MKTAALIAGALASVPCAAEDITLDSPAFRVVVSPSTGGITSLTKPGDRYDTDYVRKESAIGHMRLRYRLAGGPWRTGETAASNDVRTVMGSLDGATVRYVSDSSETDGIRSIRLEERYELQDDALVWTVRLRNRTAEPLEIGDLGLPLPFATNYDGDSATIFEKRLIRHAFISGDASWFFFERCSGVGPYLVMTPLPGTHLEYFTDREKLYTAFVHAKVQADETDAGGTWRQPITSLTLAPVGQSGDEAVYGFRFTWADDYDGVRKALVREGLVDVRAVPGMVIPQDLPAMFALTTDQPIRSIEAEYPESTDIEPAGRRNGNTRVYRVRFRKIGENRLTVSYGDGRKMYLEFFSTQPVETLVKKRADFIVKKQQIRDPSKWYDGLFSLWDMRSQVLRSPDDTAGLRAYMVGGSDDPSNCKAPYVALKNLAFPDPDEIAAVEYHLEKFVWGGLQRKDTETPYPYGIYGIDNWYLNRNSEKNTNGEGNEHLWRSFDYPALFTLYHAMFKIAKRYPGMTRYLDADEYLERAFGTARAFFEVPYSIKAWWGGYPDWTYMTGQYNEVCLPELIQDLYAEGRAKDADWLKSELEKKVKYFVYDAPYPYASEYAFDSTAYETSHLLAKYGVENDLQPDEKLWQDRNSGEWYSHPKVEKEDFHAFMERQMAANIADRGWIEPSYYLLGTDIRAGGTSGYLLSYMAQMGGWAVLDYGLYTSRTPEAHLALGYASYLSSWALVNAGDAASGYGYWFPGPGNDGAAGWAYEPQKVARPWYRIPQHRGVWPYDGEIDHGFMGGLRSAATIVVDDPVFGLYVYGGEVKKSGGALKVTLRDGLRQRFHMMNAKPALHMELERDGFVDIRVARREDASVREIGFTLENRTGDAHKTDLVVSGLPEGEYTVTTGKARRTVAVRGEARITLEVPTATRTSCTIKRK